ncbi:hypothetical protein [Shewanella surugensis]|uniref:DDE Tnp4 domain-containing protein n=1 Tax=Shewanella surugensis TaxID=212020 RepID=A0ABT0LDX9_9GAMM|nr:hypothetical protein [Shewanella surugensis]MCL1125530.1 hypothetical protein [Shewanella surugensis]
MDKVASLQGAGEPPESDGHYYADSAFSSNKSSDMWQQQAPNKKHALSGMFAMSFGDIRHVIPSGYIHDSHEIIHAPMDEAEQATIPLRFDHEKICMVKGTRDFFAIICTLGGYMSLIFLGGGHYSMLIINAFIYE